MMIAMIKYYCDRCNIQRLPSSIAYFSINIHWVSDQDSQDDARGLDLMLCPNCVTAGLETIEQLCKVKNE